MPSSELKATKQNDAAPTRSKDTPSRTVDIVVYVVLPHSMDSQAERGCTKHKEEGEINLRSPRCRMCETIASYRIDDSPIEWCIRHLPSGPLVPIPKAKATGLRFCDADGCRTRACFGFEGGLVHRCGKHREPGQINLRDRTCKFCRIRARFGFPGDEFHKAQWCSKHAPEGTIFLEHRKLCQMEGCSKVAWCGPTKSGFVHCKDHRTVDDVVVRDRSCTHCDAPTKIRCHTHRLPGDVSYRAQRNR